MSWLQSLDLATLRLVREGLHNSFFDWLMPLLSGNVFFVPAVVVVSVLLAWKGGVRARLCLLMLGLVLLLGNILICNNLKEAIGRPRPSESVLPAYLQLSEQQSSKSMPSSHAANWFSATLVCFLYYRRSVRFMLPLAVAVSYSRVYRGAHYPTDVLGGAIVGAAYAALIVLLANVLWQRAGRRWFPLWWERLPSLVTLKESKTLSVSSTAENHA